MTCKNCGTQNNGESKYCYRCGSPLINNGNAKEYGGTSDMVIRKGTGVLGSALAVIKKAGTSGAFLTGAIAYSIYVLGLLLQIFLKKSMTSNALSGLLKILEFSDAFGGIDIFESGSFFGIGTIESFINGAFGKVSIASIILQLIGMIPAIVVLCGIWTTFASLKSSQKRIENTYGLTMIQVIIVIKAVFSIIAFALGLIAVVFSAVVSKAYDSVGGIIFIIASILIIALIGVLVAIYYLKVYEAIKNAKNTIYTGSLMPKVSAWVTFGCFFGGVLESVLAVLSIFGWNKWMILVYAGSAAASIAFGVLVCKMNGDIGRIPPIVEPDSWRETPPQPPKIEPKLIWINRNISVPINKDMFRVGKATRDVDFCIEGNPSVSRQHAVFMKQGERWIIIDNNSMNHVYVDGVQATPGVPVALKDGSKIRLSNEEFLFKLQEGVTIPNWDK